MALTKDLLQDSVQKKLLIKTINDLLFIINDQNYIKIDQILFHSIGNYETPKNNRARKEESARQRWKKEIKKVPK